MPFDPDILVRLKLYAEHHFILEETYMRKLDYPGTDVHIGANDRFLEELEAMIETGSSMHETLKASLSDFFYTRLEPRVPDIDKKLEAFALESDSKYPIDMPQIICTHAKHGKAGLCESI